MVILWQPFVPIQGPVEIQNAMFADSLSKSRIAVPCSQKGFGDQTLDFLSRLHIVELGLLKTEPKQAVKFHSSKVQKHRKSPAKEHCFVQSSLLLCSFIYLKAVCTIHVLNFNEF